MQKELRWHLAVVVPRLPLTPSECQSAAEALQHYLQDRSSIGSIVKTFALQGLYDLATQGPELRPSVLESFAFKHEAVRSLCGHGDENF